MHFIIRPRSMHSINAHWRYLANAMIHANIHIYIKVAHTRLPSVGFPELIPVLGSQPAGDVSHKPGGRLPLLSARPAGTPTAVKRVALPICCLVNTDTMGVNSLPKTVTRQRRDCDLNLGPSAPESSTLTTRLPSHLGTYIFYLSNTEQI